MDPSFKKLRALLLKSREDCKVLSHRVNAVNPMVIFLRNNPNGTGTAVRTFVSKRLEIKDYTKKLDWERGFFV